MKPRVMAELLSQYVERSIAGRDDTDAYLSLFRSHHRELAPLFAVVKLLRVFLVRPEPSPTFVERLGAGLRLAAEESLLQQRRNEPLWAVAPSRRNVVIGVAALGSLASLAALLLYSRSRAEHRAA